MPNTTADEKNKLLYDLEERSHGEGQKQAKLFYAGDQYDKQALLAITEEDIALFADQTNGIAVDQKFGVLLSGSGIHLAAMPDQISIGGGYWRLDPRHLAAIPSTCPTPIPLLVKAVPDLVSAKGTIEDQL